MSTKRLYNQQKKSINNANLIWNEHGEPSSSMFDDIYFSTTDGLYESQYVFIEQNNLYQRWLNCTQSFYVIGETGFGSGLNFLVTWQAFKQFRHDNPQHNLTRLHFISFEKYPLTADDLKNSHARWPELESLANQLQAKYPMAIGGCHRSSFDINDSNQSSDNKAINQPSTQIILDLWFGDINETITQIACSKSGVVDSWYLDGFAPTKNPDMWHQGLYDNMAKLSKDNSSLATFTAAGDVRRGLIKAGFAVKKVKGFGKKREMITASFSRDNVTTNHSPWFHRPSLDSSNITNQKIVIIGGGLASAALALALAKRGLDCQILCQDSQVAQGASGNLQGGFYPLINSQHDQLSQFYCQAFTFGLNFYRPFITADNQQTNDNGSFCGVVQIAHNDKTTLAHDKIISADLFPNDLVSRIDNAQASNISGITLTTNALHYPQGGWLSPKQLTNAIIAQAKTLANIDIVYDKKVTALFLQQAQWQLQYSNNDTINADVVVLANGHGLSEFEQTKQLPLYATAGQVTHLSSFDAIAPLKTVLCYQGYLTPSTTNIHCLGASFNRDITGYAVNDDEHLQNLEKLHQDLPQLANKTSLNDNIIGGKVGVRMSVKDHLPMIGSVPDYINTKASYDDLYKGRSEHTYENSPTHPNLFMLGGLGSRGLCSAPLLAELLTCQLTGEPMPLPLPLLNQLNPNRYWIKQLKKHNVDI